MFSQQISQVGRPGLLLHIHSGTFCSTDFISEQYTTLLFFHSFLCKTWHLSGSCRHKELNRTRKKEPFFVCFCYENMQIKKNKDSPPTLLPLLHNHRTFSRFGVFLFLQQRVSHFPSAAVASLGLLCNSDKHPFHPVS